MLSDFYDKLVAFFDIEIGAVPLWRLLLFVAIIISALLVRRIVALFIKKVVAKFTSRTKTKLDDYIIESLDKPLQMLVVVAGIHIATFFFPWRDLIPEDTARILVTGRIFSLFSIIYAWTVAYFLWALIGKFGDYFLDKFAKAGPKSDITIVVVTFRKFLRILLIIVIAAMTLEKLGQDVKMIIASFTVATAALAFAGRDAIANVFAAIVLSIDRPFSIGDWVVINGVEGTVEELGMRSTKIRTFAKSLVYFPNNQLMNMSIENMSTRPRQRVKAFLGITYNSEPEKIEELIKGINQIIETNPMTYKDYKQIWFTDLADSSLQIMLYFFIESTVWGDFLEQRQKIYLDIMRLVKKLGLEFAFPTQTVFLNDDRTSDKIG